MLNENETISSTLPLILGLHASGLTAQSRYTIEGDTLTLDMTVAAPGYEFDGELDEYDENRGH